MARGQAEKDYVASKILETFEGSFAIDKEIRIPITSGGTEIQIKCVLTAAAKNVENPNGSGATSVIEGEVSPAFGAAQPATKIAEPSAEEKAKVDEFLAKLGIRPA